MSINGIVKRAAFSSTLMGVIFSPQLAFASSDGGTLTPGSFFASCNPSVSRIPGYFIVGYVASFEGTYSPTGLTGGRTVTEIVDLNDPDECGPTGSSLEVSGFSSNPGASWLTSITCNGIQNSESASGYSYSSGVATWTWGQKFGLSKGAQVSCTIVHS